MTALIAAIGLPIGLMGLIIGISMFYDVLYGQNVTSPKERKRDCLWFGSFWIVGGYVILALSRMI